MTENGRQKGTLSETVRKELRVVVSRDRSPLSLRIAKWALFLSITRSSTARGGSGYGSSVSRSRGYAVEHNKRLGPVVLLEVDSEAVPSPLGSYRRIEETRFLIRARFGVLKLSTERPA